jgi:hypothetical protein
LNDNKGNSQLLLNYSCEDKMDLLKKIILGLALTFLLPSVLMADVLDDELPGDTPVQVKEQARQIIRLGVENQGVVKMTQTMLQNRFTEQQMIRAFEIVGEARKNGLPEDPVMNKLHEGVGKRVQNKNIITAMEKVKERYQAASEYANKMSSDSDQSKVLTRHIAESMSAGMSGNHIEKIGRMFDNLKTQSSTEKSSLKIQTLRTVKTMARMGASSGSVADAVDTALRSGYDQNQMSRLEKAFVTQTRARYNPTDIAESFSRGINEGVSVDDLGRRSYMNSGSGAMGGSGFGNGAGSGAGRMGSDSSMGGSGSGGTGGSGGSGRGAGGGGGRGR